MLDGKRLDQYVEAFSKARSAEEKRAWGDALDAYTSALAAIPGSEAAAYGLAHSYWMLGNKRKANDLFQEMLEKDTVPNAWNYGEIADFYNFFMRDPDTAIPLYTKAMTCMEVWNTGWVYKGRGLAWRAKGDIEKAHADLERALQIGEARSIDDLVSECRKELAALGR